jgi:hypothetical protein
MSEQIGRDELKRMTAADIVAAHREGRLAEAMAGNDADTAAQRKKISEARDRLRQLTPDEIVAATRDGSLDGLLGRE